MIKDEVYATNSNFLILIYLEPNQILLKYQRFTSSGCRNKGIRKFVFVPKAQFLSSLMSFEISYSLYPDIFQYI